MTHGISMDWPPFRQLEIWRRRFNQIDPRWIVFGSLSLYLVLGCTVLGFNRTPSQALVTTLSCMALEVGLARVLRRRWIFPLSAAITSLSLSILLNYAHDFWILLVPVFFAIGSKYIFTFEGRHIFNPAQAGVTLSLLFCGRLITAAPAYQWYGIESVGLLVGFLGLTLVLPRVNRSPLVIAFLLAYTAQTSLRAWIMRHHLPFETLFWGSITSPAFLLFTFFMITDPATSPSGKKAQIRTGIILALLDLIFHLRQSYYTFFYAAFALQLWRLLALHFNALRASPHPWSALRSRLLASGYLRGVFVLVSLALGGSAAYHLILHPTPEKLGIDFRFESMAPEHTGIHVELGDTLTRVDARIQHMAKWILSVGDSASVGDYDGDGFVDLFLTNVLKREEDRGALYRNRGDFRFERVPLPALAPALHAVESNGLPSNALFVDYDNDGDNDLFVVYAFGPSHMLQNRRVEDGQSTFVDVSAKLGLNRFTNAMAANFFDADGDGLLDLLVGNTWPAKLPDYPEEAPEYLNIFRLPPAQFEGDERMFNFMHSSWHLSDNGGVNDFWRQQKAGTFELIDPSRSGMPEHYWTLAIGSADFNRDGRTDLYVANDFGPDNFYLNRGDFRFEKVEGSHFGDLGRDTYKGMNASVEDVDGDGFQDVYISNVHHELQAEGSLLWRFGQNPDGTLSFEEIASRVGVLNEDRFGWGAAFFDANNDGYIDLAQANGMVDDTPDRLYDDCPDYWYTNEKIARSSPDIHRYIHRWGDIRGRCIYPNELNRLYLHPQPNGPQTFVDVAAHVGLTQRANSRGVAAADFDNDGRMDLVITNQFGAPDILRNVGLDEATKAHWIGFSLESPIASCNKMALGSTMTIRWHEGETPRVVYKEHKLANGFSAQNDARIHVGLGQASGPVELEISWCGQQKSTFIYTDLDRYYEVNRL
jgi:Na+-translocating ferredoxin:NAD+ oxidoreductase RnfD subunit